MTRRTGVSECVNELFVMFLLSSGENNSWDLIQLEMEANIFKTDTARYEY